MSITTEPLITVPDLTYVGITVDMLKIREFIRDMKSALDMAMAEFYVENHNGVYSIITDAAYSCHEVLAQIDVQVAHWEEDMDRQAEAERQARAYESLPILEIPS